MRELIKGHVEMVKVIAEAPTKEVFKAAACFLVVGTLFYYSILIFG
jgi:hypothetical protein